MGYYLVIVGNKRKVLLNKGGQDRRIKEWIEREEEEEDLKNVLLHKDRG